MIHSFESDFLEMAASLAVPINSKLLVWARETSGYPLEAAALKLAIKPEKLSEIEAGQVAPSFAQLKKAADVYKRPLAVFFLEKAPERQPEVHDFRLQPGVMQRPYAPRLNNEIRQARLRRDDALELAQTLEEPAPTFTHQATADEAPEAVAARVRALLGITLDRQHGFRRTEDALKAWKAAVEAQSVLVFETSRITSEEMRGVSLPADVLPIIILNGGEAHAGRLFTLLHEFTHLLLRQGGVCDLAPVDDGSPDARIEAFCNAVAGNVLVPADALLAELPHQHSHPWDMNELEALSSRFSVSREVVLRRLLVLGRTTPAHYEAMRVRFQEENRRLSEGRKNKKSAGGPPPSVMAVRNLGRPYIRLVLSAYSRERIDLSSVSDYLGVKLKHLRRIESLVHGR